MFLVMKRFQSPKDYFGIMAITSHVDVNRIWRPKRYLNIQGSQKLS